MNDEARRILDDIFECFEDCEIDSRGQNNPEDFVPGFDIKYSDWSKICLKYEGD